MLAGERDIFSRKILQYLVYTLAYLRTCPKLLQAGVTAVRREPLRADCSPVPGRKYLIFDWFVPRTGLQFLP